MKIVIDARWVGPSPSGVGVWTCEMVRRLPRLAPDFDFVLLFDSDAARVRLLDETDLSDAEHASGEVFPYGVFSPASQILLPRWLAARECALFHSPNYMIPYRAFPRGGAAAAAGACVTTLHDAIPLLLPGHAPRARKTRFLPLFRWCLQESVRRSAAVVTVSETSRRDIVRALRLDGRTAGRVHVIPNGVDARFVPAPAAARRPVSATRTVLYVGRLDPYKDVVGLVRAFGMLRRRCTFPLHLAIVGPEDPRYPEARQIAESLGLKECVSFLGFLQPSELLAAYQEADLLVNPSHYEGFGLPLIEAMRCGLPVVCTDGGAQPEVAGDAAVIVPAGDDHALTEGMLQVLADDALRTGLVARGLRRAEQFSWERSAVALLALYRCILQPEMHGP